MSRALQERLRVKRFSGEEEKALLSLLVAAGHVSERMERVFAGAGLTGSQYNVLRILRGAPCEGYPRCDISDRLIDRCPDVTRLVDRLARQGLVERCTCETDRRLSLARITPKGTALLEQLEPEVLRAKTEFGSRLSEEDCRQLSRICERIYTVEGG